MPSDLTEAILLLLYIVLGPLMWAFYGTMLYAGRRKMLLLKRPAQLPAPAASLPSVTIMVPAKDEGERIRACIASALAQDYPNFDVIAIDDRSTDNTGAVMDEMAAAPAAQGRLRGLHNTTAPPPGWTGKNNALWQGQRLAKGEWLLLVDSDVVLAPDALSAGMAVVLRKKFDLLSLLPRLESHTLWESLLVPLAGSTASSMYLIALTNNNLRPKSAFANGQFMLMSRKAYDGIGGHEAVRDRYCEDVDIARRLKAAGWRPRVSWGNDFASVRMYSSLESIKRGWSRIYYAAEVGRPWRMVLAGLFILLCGFSAYAALGWGMFRLANPAPSMFGSVTASWLIASGIHLGLLTYFLGTMYHWSGNPRRNALMFPVAATMLLGIMGRALKMTITKKVEWRGTAYSHTMAAATEPPPAPSDPHETLSIAQRADGSAHTGTTADRMTA